MQIAIDIPDDAWEEIKNGTFDDSWNYTVFHLLEWASHGTPLKRCKDCKHFETDVVATCDGIPLIIGHECCTKWGDGCKTKEDGYCFMFEEKMEVGDNG